MKKLLLLNHFQFIILLSHELKDYNEYIIKLFKNKYDNSKISLEQFKYFDLNYSLFENNK